MRKVIYGMAMMALWTHPVFAEGHHASSDACKTVAKACADAGYKRAHDADKRLWQGCMQPLLLNQTVANVTVDAKVVGTCRQDKIADMKKELDALEKAASAS